MAMLTWKNLGAYFLAGGALVVAVLLLAKFFKPASVPPPPPASGIYRDSTQSVDVRIEDLLKQMTLQEKIGQMALVEKNSLKNPDDISDYALGALLSGGGGKPDNNTPEGWKNMVGEYVDISKTTRLGIPLLYGADVIHGNGNVPGATIFPHFIGLGAANSPTLTERVAQASAEESAALGIRWNFSPTLDLPTDIRWGRVYEAFSDDPGRVIRQGAAFVRGLQNSGVLATAKHFVGIGSMTWGDSSNQNFKIDQGLVPDDSEALTNTYLPPYEAALDAGALSVMAGLAKWGEVDMAANKYLLTDVLKTDMGFEGFVVSDWYGVYEITDSTYDATVTAINAGVDMVMLPYDYKQFNSDMNKAVTRGEIPQERVDDAVRRILRAKFAMGLFDEGVWSQPGLEVMGSDEHRDLAREAVQKSLVLLKNQGSVLPLSPHLSHIRVAGSASDNIGRQTGAWTVEWQGIDGNWLPGATSILSGIQAAVDQKTTVEYDLNGDFTNDELADVGIAVVGEKPYAEGWGDNPEPRLDDADLAAIENLKKTSKHVVVIIVSGRPLLITDELPDWEAVIAAWLLGSEGEGIADALFGKSSFTGTLPLPWPRTLEQLPITTEGQTQDNTAPLFARGFGL